MASCFQERYGDTMERGGDFLHLIRGNDDKLGTRRFTRTEPAAVESRACKDDAFDLDKTW
jgi:hypothetical protein